MCGVCVGVYADVAGTAATWCAPINSLSRDDAPTLGGGGFDAQPTRASRPDGRNGCYDRRWFQAVSYGVHV